MDAVKYFKEKTRMLNSLGRKFGKCNGASCLNCPLASTNNGKGLSCSDFEAEYPEEAVAIVEKWAAEHQQKTMFQDFLEKYPNASLTSYGTPHICPCELGYEEKNQNFFSRRCIDCWNRPIEGEVRNDRRKCPCDDCPHTDICDSWEARFCCTLRRWLEAEDYDNYDSFDI